MNDQIKNITINDNFGKNHKITSEDLNFVVALLRPLN